MKQDDKFSNLRKHFAETDYFSDEDFEKVISFLTPVTLKKKEFFAVQGDHCRYLATIYYIGGLNYFFSRNVKLMLNYEAHKELGTEIQNDFFLAQLQISF